MDTREKIVPIERVPALLASGEWTVFAGLFDPMTAAQAQRIARRREPGRKLLAMVLEDGDALLPADGRAALVAALHAVDAVAITREWSVPLGEIDAERARTEEFMHFVAARAGAER